MKGKCVYHFPTKPHLILNSNICYILIVCRYSRGLTTSEKLIRRQRLDRRRLEEAFLLYAVLKTHFTYNLEVDHIEYDRNLLVERVVDTFLEKFLEKWSGKFEKIGLFTSCNLNEHRTYCRLLLACEQALLGYRRCKEMRACMEL